MKWINILVTTALLLQTAGCHSVRTLKSLDQTEMIKNELNEGALVRLRLKPGIDLPFEERNITCRIAEIDRFETITIKSVGVPMVDSRERFEIEISNIRKMEILQRKLSAARVGGVAILVFVLMAVIGSQIELEVPGFGGAQKQ